MPSKSPSTSPTANPTDPAAPTPLLGRATLANLQYNGAFRLQPGQFGGGSTWYSINYAIGALAYHPTRHSLYIAGHAQASYVAEYPLSDSSGAPIVPSSNTTDVSQLPITDVPLQGGFHPILQSQNISNPESINR
mgnify:CR=1 FL=1